MENCFHFLSKMQNLEIGTIKSVNVSLSFDFPVIKKLLRFMPEARDSCTFTSCVKVAVSK